MTAAIAGSLVSTAALAQSGHQAPRTKRHSPVKTVMGAKRVPLRVAKARRINGKVYVVGAWQAYLGSVTDQATTPVFDCFEADPTGAPTGFCDSCNALNGNQYCPPAGTADATGRWSYPDSNTAWSINDMTVGTGAAGTTSSRVEFAWNWGPLSAQCFVAVFTDETFNPCGSATPVDGAYDGVVFDFGIIAGGAGAGYNYSDNDLSATPDVFFQMPMDGVGAYEVVLANAQDPVSGALTLDTTPGTTPMLWGCGADEDPPENRVGTQEDTQYDDSGPNALPGMVADGVMDTTAECLSYNFGVGAFCPFRLGTMVIFYGEGGTPPPSCYANCDASTTVPFLNVLDFNCFLNQFSSGTSYANCDNSTTPPVLNVLDFNCFLNSFSTGCSAP
jgi:hypothetical protein